MSPLKDKICILNDFHPEKCFSCVSFIILKQNTCLMKKRLALLLLASTCCSLFTLANAAPLIFGKSSIGFIENKGQFKDQYDHPRPDVLYVFTTDGFKLILRDHGFSYELFRNTTVDANNHESGLSTAELEEDDAAADLPLRDRCIVHRV